MIFKMANNSSKPLLNFHKFDNIPVDEKRETYTNKIMDAICDCRYNDGLVALNTILDELSLLVAKNKYTIKIPNIKTKDKLSLFAQINLKNFKVSYQEKNLTPVAYFSTKEIIEVKMSKRLFTTLKRRKIVNVKLALGYKSNAFLYLTRNNDKLYFHKLVLEM